MSRVGMQPGADASTKLLTRFTQAGATDYSASGHAFTTTGKPTYMDGYYGTGFGMLDSGVPTYLDVTGHADFAQTGSFSVECWCYPTAIDTGNTLILPQSDTYFVVELDSTGKPQFKVTGTGPTTQTLTARRALRVNEWHHIACTFEASTDMQIWVDGQLWAKATTTIATTVASGTPIMRIGADAAGINNWVGIIDSVRFRSGAFTSQDDLAPNLDTADRITHEVVEALSVDLKEDLSDDTWTASGDDWYLDAFDLQPMVFDQEDIVKVSGKTSASADEKAFKQVFNTTDLDGAVRWYWDEPNGRLYVTEDPATYASLFVHVRYRAATKGSRRGGRYHIPAIKTMPPMERKVPMWFQALPTGGGGNVELLTQHPDHFDGWAEAEATGVYWAGVQCVVEAISDHMPWQEAETRLTGFCEEQPTARPDTVLVQVRAPYARFHRLRTARSVVNKDDYSDAPDRYIGKPLHALFGLGLRDVKPAAVTATAATLLDGINSGWKLKLTVPGLNVSYLANFRVNTAGWTEQFMYDVDLANGEFWTIYDPATYDYLVDVDGHGTPASGILSGAHLAVGDRADTFDTHLDVQKAALKALAGYTDADLDSTWTDTAVRVNGVRRSVHALGSESSFTTLNARMQSEAKVFQIPRTTGLWGCRDANKAEAVDDTVHDSDIITEEWPRVEVGQVAKSAHAEALAYLDTGTEVIPGDAVTEPLVNRHDSRKEWQPSPGTALTGFYSRGELKSWLTDIKPLLERGWRPWKATLSGRFLGRDIMDVLDVQTSLRPTGAGSRVRPLSVRPVKNRVEIVGVSEDTLPQDGSSEAAARAEVLEPVQLYAKGSSAGVALTDTGGLWATVDDRVLGIYQGAFLSSSPFASTAVHTFVTEATRIGGLSASDLKFRLKIVESGDILFTPTGGHGTGSSTFDSTSLLTASLPTDDVRLILEYKTDNSATGTWYGSKWSCREGAAKVNEPYPPTILFDIGDETGWSVSADGRVGDAPFISYVRYHFAEPHTLRVVAYVDGAGTTHGTDDGFSMSLRKRIGAIGPALPDNQEIHTWRFLSAPGYYEAQTGVFNPENGLGLYAELDSGTGTVYCVNATILQGEI